MLNGKELCWIIASTWFVISIKSPLTSKSCWIVDTASCTFKFDAAKIARLKAEYAMQALSSLVKSRFPSRFLPTDEHVPSKCGMSKSATDCGVSTVASP